MDEKQKEMNRKAQEAETRKNYDSEEEFAEKIYDDKAPTPERFDEKHDVTYTGQEIQE